jgi:hypothetical protein
MPNKSKIIEPLINNVRSAKNVSRIADILRIDSFMQLVVGFLNYPIWAFIQFQILLTYDKGLRK